MSPTIFLIPFSSFILLRSYTFIPIKPNMFAIIGFSLAYGLCSALDTLVSQAYGAKLYRLAGLYTQRAAVILTLSSIPVGILWYVVYALLKSRNMFLITIHPVFLFSYRSQTHIILQYGLAIPPDVAALAGTWARLITLGTIIAQLDNKPARSPFLIVHDFLPPN